MAEKSIFQPGGSGMTTGGLDGYLGPEAVDYSNLPLSIEDPDAEDLDGGDKQSQNRGEGGDSSATLQQISDAEKQIAQDRE